MTAAKGRFITLEGGEGAGKTTHIETAQGFLESQGIAAMRTREPGGNEVAEAIRGVLLDPELPGMHADTELMLMFAARNEHLQQKIIPALQRGTWVICDRFTDATYAYQGYGRKLPLERIAMLERWVQGELRPDHTLLFDIDVATGMQRVQQRSLGTGQQTDRLEREKQAFYEDVRQGYLQQAASSPERFTIIDASQDKVRVAESVQSVLQTLIDPLELG